MTLCADCPAEITSRAVRCRSCAIARAQTIGRTRESGRRKPDKRAVQAEADRLPAVLEHYLEESRP